MSILFVVAVIGLFVIGLAWLDGGHEEPHLMETPVSLPEATPEFVR